MTKIGIGVGEDFPVDDAASSNPPQPPGDGDPPDHPRPWRRRHWLHIAARVAFLVLIVSALAWAFGPHHFGPYAADAVHPYPHHFFFPFFPILLVLLLFAFARRGGCYGWRHHGHHGHHEHHHHYHYDRGAPREEA